MQGVHLTQAFETLHVDLAFLLLRLDTVKYTLLFGFIQSVVHVLAHIDTIKRWHGYIHVSRRYQGPEMAHKKGADQGSDMQAVGIGIRQNTNLVVTQGRQVITHRVDTQRYRNIVHFLRRQNFLGIHFPGVQNFAAQGQDGLEHPVPRLLRRATGGVALHQEQFAAHGVLPGTIR